MNAHYVRGFLTKEKPPTGYKLNAKIFFSLNTSKETDFELKILHTHTVSVFVILNRIISCLNTKFITLL